MDIWKRMWRIIQSQKTSPIPDIELEHRTSFHAQQPSQDPKEAQYYANLEIAYGSNFKEIKRQYRKLLILYHPDRYNNDAQKIADARIVTEKLNEAYQYFKNKWKS